MPVQQGIIHSVQQGHYGVGIEMAERCNICNISTTCQGIPHLSVKQTKLEQEAFAAADYCSCVNFP